MASRGTRTGTAISAGWRSASGKVWALADEERAGGDEEREAHPPQVPHQARPAVQPPAADHPHVGDRRQEENRAHEQDHRRRHALANERTAGDALDSLDEPKDAE